jgi:hypothetical protein
MAPEDRLANSRVPDDPPQCRCRREGGIGIGMVEQPTQAGDRLGGGRAEPAEGTGGGGAELLLAEQGEQVGHGWCRRGTEPAQGGEQPGAAPIPTVDHGQVADPSADDRDELSGECSHRGDDEADVAGRLLAVQGPAHGGQGAAVAEPCQRLQRRTGPGQVLLVDSHPGRRQAAAQCGAGRPGGGVQAARERVGGRRGQPVQVPQRGRGGGAQTRPGPP